MNYPEDVNKALASKGVLGKSICPICKQKTMDVISNIYLGLPGFDIQTQNSTGKGSPYVGLECNNCGYLQLHNSKILGIFQKYDGSLN